MSLLLKELWVLRYWGILIFMIEGTGVGFIASTGFLDENYLQFGRGSGFLAPCFLLGLGTAATAFGHERYFHTQRFLDALPLRPIQVFFTKALAALLITFLPPLLGVGLSHGLGALFRTSVDPDLPWQHGGVIILLCWVYAFAMVGIGSLLSFTHRWFAAFVGLLFLLYFWLNTQDSGWAALFKGSNLMVATWEGSRLVALPWMPLLGHLGLGVAGFAGGCLLYCGREGWFSRWMQARRQSLWLRWTVRLSPAAAIAVWIAVLVLVADVSTEGKDDRDDDDDIVYSAPGTADAGPNATGEVVTFERHQTKTSEFLFRSNQRTAAKALWISADAMAEQALAAFGGQGRWPGRVVVDLSAEIPSHAAAQAHWTKIRFPLERVEPEARPHVLRHEMAHVIIEQISDGLATKHFEEMRAFHEGMATFVELSGPGDAYTTRERERHEQAAALAWSRGPVPLTDLLRESHLGLLRDESLVYPLGLMFVEALITTGGADMPRLMMHTLRTHPPSPGLRGDDVWRHLFSRTGHSWERVEAVYTARLTELVSKHRPLIDRLPRLTVMVSHRAEEIVLTPGEVSVPEGYAMVCVVETRSSLISERQSSKRAPDGSFRLPKTPSDGSRARYMLGWLDTRTKAALGFEPWADLPLAGQR